MNANGKAFMKWALDAERTVEEKFSVQLLIEHRVRDHRSWGWERRRIEHEARRYNPAWVPVLDPAEVRKLARKLGSVKHISLQGHDDRPLRSLEFLRFLPHLEKLWEIAGVTDLTPLRHAPQLKELHIGSGAEVTNLSPVSLLHELESFHIGMNVVEDYRPLAQCLKLKTMHVYCTFPWPRMEGWEALVNLESITWHGSALGFMGIKHLPSLRVLDLTSGNMYGGEGAMRDLGQLPEMPELRTLWAKHFFHLDGIERYPKLQAALVAGSFRTAAPAARCPELMHLRIWSDELREVKSLASAPALHQLVVMGKRPQDYSALAEAPMLRQLLACGCEMPQVDVETMRVLLPGWEEYFAAAEPRPLKELTFHWRPQPVPPPPQPEKNEDEEEDAVDEAAQPPRPVPELEWWGWPVTGAAWEWSPCFQRSAHDWCERGLRAAFDAHGLKEDHGFLVGDSLSRREDKDTNLHRWTSIPHSSSRVLSVDVLTARALSRLREVVECSRAFLTTLRDPWKICIHGTATPDDDDWGRPWVADESAEARAAEDREREKQRLRDQELLAQELRLSLLQEQGLEPDPKEFGLKQPPPGAGNDKGGTATATKAEPDDQPAESDEKPPVMFDAPNLDWNDRDDEDDADGGLKEADPNDEDNDEHWLPAPPNVDPNTFWTGLLLFLDLTEDTLEVPHRNREAVEYLMSLGE